MRNYTSDGTRESAQLRSIRDRDDNYNRLDSAFTVHWETFPCNGPIRRPISSIDIGSKIPRVMHVEYTTRVSKVSSANFREVFPSVPRKSGFSIFRKFAFSPGSFDLSFPITMDAYRSNKAISCGNTIFSWLAWVSLRNHGFAVPWPNMASFLPTAG